MGRRRRTPLVPGAESALDDLKQRVATEVVQVEPRTLPRAARPDGNSALQTPSRERAASSPAAQVAKAAGIPFHAGDNGNLRARDAGKIGGVLGGSMIQRLIALAEQELANPSAPAQDESPRRIR
ncbi:hypothetical protein GCM10025857_34880 [Alicyclobacillus contaminans]|uniref:alpha/beta-type small acid-soluble spore protein n=1 Tax=Alicyclobacillus contaminans TaxID=392016 RepID=UPI000685CD3C|nr:alpha/beta-type small acid-soluble spore protein [Alicyclobacillus contaminans]GMA52131.1 hypothetical protein GCM10025857_34880 [Alicyclobacillus contaminans]